VPDRPGSKTTHRWCIKGAPKLSDRSGPPTRRSIEALTEWLDDENSGVRRAAAEALSEISPSDLAVTEALTERLDDEDSWVRGAAAEALIHICPSDPAVVKALLDVLHCTSGRSANRIAEATHPIPWHILSEAQIGKEL
jgi:hypothetical protein